MSGHSKWSKIKRQKGVTDARRGQAFTKLIQEITLAAREGGSDPVHNPRLRLAIQKARDNNMPVENIERAIKHGVGGGEGATLTEATLEGYGPGGVAVMLQLLTDNRNRAIQEARSVFTRGGGSLAEAGSVAWNFEPKGVITVGTDKLNAEEVALYAIDAGAEDVKIERDYLEIYTKPEDLEAVRQALEQKKMPVISAEVSLLPKTTVLLDEKFALQAVKLLDRLEELDDVQRVFSNVDFSDEVLEKLRAQA